MRHRSRGTGLALTVFALFAIVRLAAGATDDSYRRSVAQISADAALADGIAGPRLPAPRLSAPRGLLPGTPASPAESARTLEAPPVAPPSPDAPQTLGVSFLGATSAETNAFPPDTMGAAGPSQF